MAKNRVGDIGGFVLLVSKAATLWVAMTFSLKSQKIKTIFDVQKCLKCMFAERMAELGITGFRRRE